MTRHLLRSRLRGWRLLGAAALALLQPVLHVLVTLTEPAASGPREAAERLHTTVAGAGVFVAIAMVMLAATTLRDERDDHTLPWLVLKPLPRWQVAGATVLAAVAANLAIAALATAGTTVAGVVTGAGTTGLSAAAFLVPAAIGYGAVGAAVGYLAPRGLMVMLAYIFIWEGIGGSLVPLAANTSLWRISLSVWAGLSELSSMALQFLEPVTASAAGGLAKIGVAVALALGLLWWAVRHRDLV